MRYFNTSGPNIIEQHYTLIRTDLIVEGVRKVRNDRYFTIWAPRQTGKSTYFHQLTTELSKADYKVAHVNFENHKEATLEVFMRVFMDELKEFWEINFSDASLQGVFHQISRIQDKKWVLIIDEVEGINAEFFGQFLHSIRKVYHSRQSHALKSVILVGVSNIVGVVQDNASPFNITDNLNIPYFTNEETFTLLGQHEAETGQLFAPEVKASISEITANQPGLVNGFAAQLIQHQPNKPIIDIKDYLWVEKQYLKKNIDKNISNIINRGSKYRTFLERLLFTEEKVPFQIYKEHIKELFVNGIIISDDNDDVTFRVPLYKKCLHDAFYPYLNGEQNRIQKNIDIDEYFTETGALKMPKVIEKYKEYAKLRGFRFFLDRDDKGKVISIREAALMYSFETYINAFLAVVGGSSYIEPHVNLGIADITIDVNGQKAVVESKVYHNITQFKNGKTQTAYYASRMGLTEGTYLVFVDSEVTHRLVLEAVDLIYGVTVTTYLIPYDLKADFKKKKGQ
jgi:5S rRNA maturation endonuclease (ribonuclease M5)